MNSPVRLQEIQQNNNLPDTRVDMFSTRGFALAQRIAHAFSSSDAVPVQFRSHVLKKVGNQEQWVENPAATGNCIVAIEVAQAVGMSITAVMQNCDIIEGKLRWSGKFVIAAINASRRFTPLRFDIQNFGKMTAAYKEKGSWNNEARRYNMIDREVEIENLQCIAWAIPAGVPMPSGVYTLRQAREAGLPVIESAPVSMKMAVEEGWYAKAGSKWQTEMKHLMLQYRAGTFFGNIHAPDIVMGMGRTSEEERDVIEAVQQVDGSFAVDLTSLRPQPVASSSADTGEISDSNTSGASAESASAQGQQGGEGAASLNPSGAPGFEDAISSVASGDYDMARDIARGLSEAQAKQIETAISNAQQPQQQTNQPRRPRGGAPIE